MPNGQSNDPLGLIKATEKAESQGDANDPLGLMAATHEAEKKKPNTELSETLGSESGTSDLDAGTLERTKDEELEARIADIDTQIEAEGERGTRLAPPSISFGPKGETQTVADPEAQLIQDNISKLKQERDAAIAEHAKKAPHKYNRIYNISSNEVVPVRKGDDTRALLGGIVLDLAQGGREEFKDKSFDELSRDQQRVVYREFDKKYVFEDKLKEWMKEQGYEDLTRAGHAWRSAAKAGVSLVGETVKGQEKLLHPNKGSRATLDRAKHILQQGLVGELTMKEYEEAIQSVQEDYYLRRKEDREGYENPGQLTGIEDKEGYLKTRYPLKDAPDLPGYYALLSKGGKALEGLDVESPGSEIQDFAAGIASDPEYRGEFLTETLPSAAGSMVPIVIAGMFSPVASASMGALANASSQYDDAIRSGATEDEAWTTFAIGMGIGATEAISVGKFLGRLNKATGGRFKNAAKGAAEEGGQELFQDFANNLTAKLIYDESRKLIDSESLEEGGAGAVLGALLNAFVKGKGKDLSKSDKEYLDKIDTEAKEKGVEIEEDWKLNLDGEAAPEVDVEEKAEKVEAEPVKEEAKKAEPVVEEPTTTEMEVEPIPEKDVKEQVTEEPTKEPVEQPDKPKPDAGEVEGAGVSGTDKPGVEEEVSEVGIKTLAKEAMEKHNQEVYGEAEKGEWVDEESNDKEYGSYKFGEARYQYKEQGEGITVSKYLPSPGDTGTTYLEWQEQVNTIDEAKKLVDDDVNKLITKYQKEDAKRDAPETGTSSKHNRS